MNSDDHQRDALSYIVASLIGSGVAGAANLLRRWPRSTWVSALGKWLSSLVAGLVTVALGWEVFMPLHPWPLFAMAISAGWLGSEAMDRLASHSETMLMRGGEK